MGFAKYDMKFFCAADYTHRILHTVDKFKFWRFPCLNVTRAGPKFCARIAMQKTGALPGKSEIRSKTQVGPR